MDTFRLLKLKNYFIHLITGTAAVLFGAGILQAILLEMVKEYDSGSKTAYIFGIFACAAIILYGVYGIFRAFHYEKGVLKSLKKEERRQFIKELTDDVELSIPGQVVITKHYLLLTNGRNFSAMVLPKDSILACYQPDSHQEKTATAVQLILYDKDFKAFSVNIRGKGSGEVADNLFQKICENMPWIFHEDYDSFLDKSRKSGYRSKILKQLQDARMRYETGYNSESEAEEELQAMSEDVKERLNLDSLRKRFFSKKSK